MLKHRFPQRSVADSPDYLMGSSPFQSSCSIYQFFAGGDRGRVLDCVVDDLQRSARPHQSGNSVKVCGESGSGKTMLGLVLAHRLKNKYNVVRYDHPCVNAERLIQHLLVEFCPLQTRQLIAQLTDADPRLVDGKEPDYAELVRAIKESGQIKPVVLMLDSPVIDADSWPVLDQLNGLRVDGKPVVRTIVFEESSASTGYPVTEDIASGGDERTDQSYQLRRLSLSEIHEYLQHQMLLFDFSRRDTFTREMAYFIADRTSGVFRDLNALARGACTIAGVHNASDVTLEHLLQAGLPQKPQTRESRALNVIRTGGLRFAIIVASVLATLTTVLLTRI